MSREIQELESRASSASVAFRPQYLARAAELAAGINRREEALRLFGSAIDGYLEAGRARAAEVLCRRVLSEYPQVVRARRTLALLALGRGDYHDADRLIHEYAEAARKYGDAAVLARSLRMMASVAGAGPVLHRAAIELQAVGDAEGARMVLKAATASQDAPVGEEAGDWSTALQAALLGPADVPHRTRFRE